MNHVVQFSGGLGSWGAARGVPRRAVPGHTRALTLAELHRRVDAGTDATDPHDIGGCGCGCAL